MSLSFSPTSGSPVPAPMATPDPWFVDDNHVVLPVVRHRLCVDYFISYTGYFLTWACFLWAVLATVLGAGVSPYFLVSAVLAGLILPLSSYGEWAISAREAGHVLAYITSLFWLTLALVWSGGAGYLQVRQGKEAIEEGWYVLQTQALPFTTQLDFKRQLESNATIILGLACSAGLLMLVSGVAEGWKALGGNLIMAHMKLAVPVALGVAVATLAGGSAAYAIMAATVSAFALPSSAGIQALLWHGSVSVLAGLLAAAEVALPAALGVTFLGHAVVGVLALPMSFILLVTSLVLQSVALGVDAWVEPRWLDGLQQFVPERFQGLPWDKYAEAAYTPMQEAALTGLLLAVVLLLAGSYHLVTAALIWSVGPQLAIARSRLQAQHLRILNASASSFPAALAAVGAGGSGFGVGSGGGGEARPRYSDAAPGGGSDGEEIKEWGAGAKAKVGWAPVGVASALGSVALSVSGGDSSAAGLSSPLKGSAGGRKAAGGYGAVGGGYGSTGGGGEDPLTVRLSSSSEGGVAGGNDEDDDDDGGGGKAGASGAAGQLQQTRLHQRPVGSYQDGLGGGGGAVEASRTGGISGGGGPGVAALSSAEMPAHYPGGLVAAAEVRARVAAMQQYQLLLLSYEKQVGSIGKRSRWPSGRQWLAATSAELVHSAQARPSCFAGFGAFFLACLIALAVTLGKVGDDAKCGALGYAPATVTYAGEFQIESGLGGGYSPVVILHNFPFGSVQIIAEHANNFPEPKDRNFSFELTAYGSGAKGAATANLPTLAQLAAMVNISTDCGFVTDDDIGGCLGVTFTLTPPEGSLADARTNCLGLRLVIRTVAPSLFYTVQSTSAMLNFSGNSAELVSAILKSGGALTPFAPTFQSLKATTDSGAIVGLNVYAAVLGESAPALTTSLVAQSSTGNIFLKDTVAQSASVFTGAGNIVASTFISGSGFCGICGELNLTAMGSGQIVLSQLLAAYSLTLTTEHGSLVAVNTAMDVALDIVATSKDGAIVFSNVIQLHGNRTILRTDGPVTATALFANYVDIQVAGSSKVGVTEIFLGLPAPVKDDPNDIPFSPPFVAGQNYTYPALVVRSDRGDVTLIGVGGDPRAASNANVDSLFVTTRTGDIKVEVSGGGMNANYTIQSVRGKAVVEIGGITQPLQGQLDAGSDPVARNSVNLFTTDGDVQLALLPSPL